MRKTTKTVITFCVLASLMTLSVYSATIYDMQKVNPNVEKPKAEFSICYETSEGKSGEVTSNSKYYDSDVYSFDQSPTSIKVPVGTKIDFIDSSSPGSGTRITAYDFQVYTPSESKLYYFSSLDEMKTMTLDEEGKYEFYLCVMDNYQRVNGYDNWSVNGNHRWLTKKQNSTTDKFWWYFTQVNVYVYGKDEESDMPIIEDPEIENPEIEEPEIINHNPELHIIKPDRFYPVEITGKGIKTNTIRWVYYDEDGDDFGWGGYELYKKTNGTKTLIDSNSNIRSEDDLFVNIEGNMGDKFSLTVYVYDSEGNRAIKSTDFEIISLEPKIQILNKDRTYISDDLDIEIKRLDTDLASHIDVNYLSYKVLDEDGKIIESGNGTLPSKLILKDKYKEDQSYTIIQWISEIGNVKKKFESRFYIVPILEPLVSLDMINGYLGETKETGLVITQKQSPLIGTLPEYVYNFTNRDGYYEIYYGQTLKYRGEGLCYELELDDRFEQGKTYKLVQYVTNGAGKNGKGTTNIQIKEAEESKLMIQIIERDNNPLTPFDEIYPKEKIFLKSNLISAFKTINKKSWIENYEGKAIYQISDLFNGLVRIDEVGKYKAFSEVLLDNGETLKAEVSFIVKEIQKPIITHDVVKNTYLRNDIFSPNMKCKDINVSEEHPNGYELECEYEWNEKSYEGLFKSEKLYDYENKRVYYLIQKAFNKDFKNILTDEKVEFYLDNIKPVIDVQDYYECSCGEEITIKATAYDEDGEVTVFSSTEKGTIKNVDKHTKEMQIKFSSLNEGTYHIKLTCMDDSGDEATRTVFVKVDNNKEYPYVKLVDASKGRLKENRYIQIECGNEFDLENNVKIDNTLIADEINCDDYHLIIEENTNAKIVLGLYFKHQGTFEISNSIYVNNIEIKRCLTLNVLKDEEPQISISSDKEVYRSPETKEASCSISYNSSSDDLIDKIELYVDGEKVGSFADGENIMTCFGTNILGNKKIYAKIYETHNYLPNKEHKLYNELVMLLKNASSNVINVSILNMKPEINFNIKSNSKIRIIK